MDSQKVEQVLKQIFEMYGVEIVRKQSSFRAAVFDLLDEQNYRDERIVLRNAIEADAILPLVTVSPVTEDVAARAEEKLRKSAHMTPEDAEFVIRCVVSARGQNPDLVVGKKIHEEKVQQFHQKNVEKGPRQRVEQSDKYESSQSGKNEKEHQKNERQEQWEQQNQNEGSIFEAECKRRKKEGKLCLYKDKLVFTQYLQRAQTEIYYYNISNIRTQSVAAWLMIMFCIYGILLGIVCIAAGVIFGIICSIASLGGLIYTVEFIRRCINIRADFRSHLFIFKNKADRKKVLEIIQNELKQ